MNHIHTQWHGDRCWFGLHHDRHAGEKDAEVGSKATPERLIPILRLAGADFVQTDCKGHPGYTSWRSRTPEASVPEGLKRNGLVGWRKATASLGIPLHCHYSGIWDQAAGKRHPDWGVITADGRYFGSPADNNPSDQTNQIMCPRGPYLEELMLPQLKELIDRYEVDGFWIDGDIWAARPCYCDRCKAAFRRETGIGSPPEDLNDENWPAWIHFTLRSFEQYVTRYCQAVQIGRASCRERVCVGV